ncbi:protein phosphatase 1D-like [Dysidea avara]|uniref:protein phosphatase 1D-like n=1 Tax=Dysidea avara TaxID=196820 RepID=UPI00332AD97A
MAANVQLVQSTGLIARGQKMKGDRSVCEDFITVEIIREKNRERIDFLALFDGHAGVEAAEYARDNLCQTLKENEDIYSSDPVKVSRAMETAFMKIHEDMWSARDTWKQTVKGIPSYAGTTVACALFKADRVHIANVGDSKIILACRNPNYGGLGEPEILAKELSMTHRPVDVEERKRIEHLGGSVYVSARGDTRILWEGDGLIPCNFPRPNLSRSLGDLWSVTRSGEYLMSPVPYTCTHYLTSSDLFFVIASDGIWDVIDPQEVAEIVYSICKGPTVSKDWMNKRNQISYALKSIIDKAYFTWHCKNLRADNISCVIVYYTM